MKKKNILALLLFSCVITLALFFGANLMTSGEVDAEDKDNNTEIAYEANDNSQDNSIDEDLTKEEPWLSLNPSDKGINLAENNENDELEENENDEADTEETVSSNSLEAWSDSQLIRDCTEIDYYSYVPDIEIDSKVEVALDIDNPDIKVNARAAILMDADTGEVLYHKNAYQPVFPASTSKLLSSIVTLEWCEEDEEVYVGDEVNFIASDSSVANIKKGQTLTIGNLLEGMLLPSGNDAAYVAAAYVGRKSLQDPGASGEIAVGEFVRLMNEKAISLGTVNSCFKTPDGYDAIGQYTTAYDMGLIGLAAYENETILEISNKPSSHNIFVSGEETTWKNSNALINSNSGVYYPYAQGLKTGTSTMAGRCLVASASKDGKEVLGVILDSTSMGRYNDAIAMFDFALK